MRHQQQQQKQQQQQWQSLKGGCSPSSPMVPDAQPSPSTPDILCSDPTVILYVKQLDAHRKKCELSGRCARSRQSSAQAESHHLWHPYCQAMLDAPHHRVHVTPCPRYSEAAAAAARIKDLKAAEAERLKQVLTSTQQAELQQLQANFQQVRRTA